MRRVFWDRRRGGRRAILGAAILVVLLAALAGGAHWMEHRRGRSARPAGGRTLWTDENIVEFGGQSYGFDHRVETFLFLGTDASGNEEGKGDAYHGAMADYILLMVLDYTDDAYGCLQIDRNTMTLVSVLGEDGKTEGERPMQICASHWYGNSRQMSAENTVDAVRHLLGGLDHIDGYYVLNMEDIGLLNHAVGGVEVTVLQDLSASDPALTEGATLTLDDDQAMHFVRARMLLADDTNAARMSRQKQYMDGLLQKVRQRAGQDPDFAARFWKELRHAATTDMSGNDFSRISQMFLKGENRGILLLEGETKLGQVLGDGIDHEEFYPEEGSICAEMTSLFSLVALDPDEIQ